MPGQVRYWSVPSILCAVWLIAAVTAPVMLDGRTARAGDGRAGDAVKRGDEPAASTATGRDSGRLRRGAAGRKRALDAGDLVGHGGPIRAIASEPKSRRLLTGSFDYAMMLWQLDEGGAAQILKRFDQHDGAVSAVAFAPSGKYGLAGSDDGAVHVWDLVSGKRLHLLAGHGAKVLGIDITADGRWAVSASWDRTVRVWDLATGKPAAVLKGHTGPVNAARFTTDGAQIVSAAYDGTLRLWDRASGQLVRVAYKHGWGINVLERLGAEGGGSFVFGGIDGNAGIFDLAANRVVRKLERHEKPVLSVAVLDKPGLLAIGDGGGVIRVYRQGDWSLLESFTNPLGPVWAAAFALDGARLYFGSLDDFATAWQVVPRKPFEPVRATFPRRFQVDGDVVTEGERQFARKCSICHTLGKDDANRAGPTLYRIFGRRAGSLPGYPYSKALKGLDLVWTPETLGLLFEIGPHEYTPGSKMPLQRITDKAKRDALVRYLEAASGPRATAKEK